MNLYTQLQAAARRASYARRVRALRRNLAPGEIIRVIRPDGTHAATVLNVRIYAHGQPECYLQGESHSFAGWYPVEALLPFETCPDSRAALAPSLFEVSR